MKYPMSFSRACASLFACMLLANHSFGTLYRDLNFSSGSWTTGSRSDAFYYGEDGNTHLLPFKGDEYQAWLTSSASPGNTALGLALFKEATHASGGRMEFQINDSSCRLYMGQRRFVGFRMNIHSTSDYPIAKCTFFQAWQSHKTSLGGRIPPFSLEFKANAGGWYWDILYSEDSLPVNQYTLLETSNAPLPEGVWFDVIIELLPSHTGDNTTGFIKIEINGESIESNLDWGYLPTAEGGSHPQMNGFFDLRCGVYRAYQTTDQIFFFDDIKYGTSRSEVAP